jgi:hypothetical protein
MLHGSTAASALAGTNSYLSRKKSVTPGYLSLHLADKNAYPQPQDK